MPSSRTARKRQRASRTPGGAFSITVQDRDAARRALARLKSPEEICLAANSGEAQFFAVVHMVEMLMEFARPVPPALQTRLVPWMIAMQRRRERLLAETRGADRQVRASENTSRSAAR